MLSTITYSYHWHVPFAVLLVVPSTSACICLLIIFSLSIRIFVSSMVCELPSIRSSRASIPLTFCCISIQLLLVIRDGSKGWKTYSRMLTDHWFVEEDGLNWFVAVVIVVVVEAYSLKMKPEHCRSFPWQHYNLPLFSRSSPQAPWLSLVQIRYPSLDH